jgi:hypothetical protein
LLQPVNRGGARTPSRSPCSSSPDACGSTGSTSADLCDRGTIERLAAAYAASLRELLAHCRAAGTAYTPGDFTYADLGADDLANLLAELDEA